MPRKGWPLAPAFGGCGLDRAWRSAEVCHQEIDGEVWPRCNFKPLVFSQFRTAVDSLIVAFIGILLSQLLDMPVMDGVASLVIGGILAATAAYLAYECKGLLTGESAGRVVVPEIEQIITGEPDVHRVNELLTMHFGPHDILLNVSLDFADRLSSAEVENHVSALERRIKERFPDIKRIFIEAQRSSTLNAGITS